MYPLLATNRNAMSTNAQFRKSKVSNLFRHNAGNYYAITKVRGKIKRRCLDTDDFNLAKNRLTDALDELRGATEAHTAGTLREAITAEAARANAEIKETTRHYYQQCAKSMLATSDGLESKPADKAITRATLTDLRTWMDAHAPRVSRTRYNGALALLRRTYERAIESKQVGKNLALKLTRLTPLEVEREIPTKEEFAAIVSSIANQGKTHSRATAAAVRLLAATGLRISEANRLRWRHIKADKLTVKTSKQKDDKSRTVPLTAAAKEVLRELKAVLPSGSDDPVMPIKSPRIALENACERLGVPHLRVHDLRHIFATRCIEAKVDTPTIAVWLGHGDGGVLVAQVYGHIIAKHSDQQVKGVEI